MKPVISVGEVWSPLFYPLLSLCVLGLELGVETVACFLSGIPALGAGHLDMLWGEGAGSSSLRWFLAFLSWLGTSDIWTANELG